MARRNCSDELCIATGCAQPGHKRFSNGITPAVANGRNNLTALSRELDLYFVAELSDIHVYRPWFPNQSLSNLLYKWTLPVSAPGLPGYLDRRHPHAINSILVDRLGLQEVLVCACDDGDVLLYYTKPLEALLRAIEVDADHDGWLKPLIVQNIGKSAWGLAVHRNARMLGVSCNTHDVTVFAFALTDDSVLYNNPETEWQYPGRSRDTSLTLRAHHTNIPNIAFFNSDLDKEGRYLVSTDLTGLIILWDLRERNRLKQIHPNASSIHPNPHSGWSVACLDPRWFLITVDDKDFLGCKSEKDAHGTFDITQARLRIKDASTSYQAASRPNSAAAEDGILDRIRQRVAEIRGDMLHLLRAHEEFNGATDSELESSTIAGDNITPEADESDIALSVNAEVEEAEDIDDEDDAELQDMDFDMNETLDDASYQPADHPSRDNQNFTGVDWASNAILEDSQPSTPQISDDESATGNAEIEILNQFESQTEEALTTMSSFDISPSLTTDLESNATYTMIDNYPQRSIISRSLTNTTPSEAPFVLFHAGADFVSLQTAPFKDLEVLSRDPCYQLVPPNMAWLLHYDRLSLTLLIPELSVIVAATPTGRAAIYTMTRRRGRTKDEFSLRLDHIVPFSSQERLGKRPKNFLMGIAAAPMQGHNLIEQRWRLLMTYSDHTVLSYELWRKDHSRPSFV